MESTVNYLQVSPFVHQNYQCPALNPVKIRCVNNISKELLYAITIYINKISQELIYGVTILLEPQCMGIVSNLVHSKSANSFTSKPIHS